MLSGLKMGVYDLLPNFKDVFALENEGPGNPENIFVIGNLAQANVGYVRQQSSLHYNQLTSTP